VSFRTILILVNLVAIAALVVFIVVRVVSLRRNPHHHDPENLTPFYDDDVLEGAHLERALGVALIALIIVLIGMVGYFMREPFRSAEADDFFKDSSVERGAVLFANDASEDYNATVSLLCANCHGVEGGGGTAPAIIKSTDPRCDPTKSAEQAVEDGEEYCLPQSVSWAAPDLQLAALRYSRAQLTNIITYGRPGTPMPAWGVASGRGSLNEQSIQDLVSFVISLATTSDKAEALATKDLADMRETLDDPDVRAAADEWVASATEALADAQAELDALGPARTAERTTAEAYVQYTEEGLTAATEWRRTVAEASGGEVLFMNNCARCHTRGWSYFDPKNPTVTAQGLMGGGAYGPNLRAGAVNTQSSPPNGEAELFAWISEGVPANTGYGARGISSGRMPHFGAVLAKDQICEIMAYERNIDAPPLSTAADRDCLAEEAS
jgi:mono/diheme cytochrome c family protein